MQGQPFSFFLAVFTYLWGYLLTSELCAYVSSSKCTSLYPEFECDINPLGKSTFGESRLLGKVDFWGKSSFEETRFCRSRLFGKVDFLGKSTFKESTFEKSRLFGKVDFLGKSTFSRLPSWVIGADKFRSGKARFLPMS
jgi:hypothetical protein